jgi:hypothetical protein
MNIDDFYFDKAGKPITLDEFGALVANDTYKRVAETTIGEAWISTVWIGINSRWSGDGPPIIFETMIFGGPHDGYQYRYSTQDEALAGHARAETLVRDDVANGRQSS